MALAFDHIVTTDAELTTALAAVSAGDSIRVKKGEYTGEHNVNVNIFMSVESGTTFSHANGFKQSTNPSHVEWGNGCTVTNAYTISASDCYFKCKNGFSSGGMTVNGARTFHDGGE